MNRLRKLLLRFFGRERVYDPTAELLNAVQTTIENYRRSGVKIGDNCYVHGVLMAESEPIEIGNNCVLTNCTVLGHDASPALFIPELQRTGLMDRISKKKLTRIHDNCFIGTNAVILCGVSVGPNSIVGAGAIVTKDVPAFTVVAGNPAKVVCTIDEYIAKHRLQMKVHPEHYGRIGLK